jgi:hypothetical protein
LFFTVLHSPASLLPLVGVFLFPVPPALSWWRGKVPAGFERVRARLRARAARLQMRMRVWLLSGQPESSGEDVREGRDQAMLRVRTAHAGKTPFHLVSPRWHMRVAAMAVKARKCSGLRS